MKRKTYPPVKTAQKVFKLLEVLAEKQPSKPPVLVRELGMTRSNVHRILSTLLEMGYVEKNSDSRYVISPKMFKLGTTVHDMNLLSRISRPYLSHLAEISQENIHLAILYENKVLYMDSIDSKHYLRFGVPVGKTVPSHCTALGKILLSGLNDHELEAFLRSEELVACTNNTVIDPEVLIRIIQNARKEGYATDFEEFSPGIHCIASGVCDYKNNLIGAISISGPGVRLTKEKMEELKRPLIEITREISEKMGCTKFGTSDAGG